MRIRLLLPAILAGILALMLIFPGSGVDTQPPTCWSMLGYEVPCEAWVSWAAGIVTAVVVGGSLWLMAGRRLGDS